MDKIITISKESILEKVNSYDILNYYLTPYHKSERLMTGFKINNPFLAKSIDNPSFYIYCALPSHEWRYKDKVTVDEGSCFDLVMNLHNLTFSEALVRIDADLNLILKSSNIFVNLHCETLENMILKFNNAPKIPYLWAGIKTGSFGFIFGPSKSGKTIFCENLGISIANGSESFFFNNFEETPKKVLFISLEEYWQPRTERNKLQFEFLNKKLGVFYLTVNENFPRILTSDEDWKLLRKHIIESNAEVVFIDSLSRMYSGSIEDSSTAKLIALKLRELTNDLKITLIIIHHTPKQIGRPLTIDSLAGSRMLAQEADFLIGISKAPDGTRYMKEVAYRYKQENDETVVTFTINSNAWLVPNNKVSEGSILSNSDGRIDNTNSDVIFEFINENSNINPQTTAKELLTKFVDSEIMSKPTMYTQIRKLLNSGKITNPVKGVYELK